MPHKKRQEVSDKNQDSAYYDTAQAPPSDSMRENLLIMRKDPTSGILIFSPSDLVRYLESPFSSWMDRHHLEHPQALTPDPQSEDMKLIAETGKTHEAIILKDWKAKVPALVEIHDRDLDTAHRHTLEAISKKAPVIYQGALRHGNFAGLTDFLELDPATDTYLLWDTKVARSIKPYYAIQLCCYAEMLAHTPGTSKPEYFGIILGTMERPQLRVSEYYDYYLSIKEGFLKLQQGYDGDLAHRPEPEPRADHGRWTTEAEAFFDRTDHLVRVAGITSSQIIKLRNAGITTLKQLAGTSGIKVAKLQEATLAKLVAQARLQSQTRLKRETNPKATAEIEILPIVDENGVKQGLAALYPPDPADIFFDLEGYPLRIGGLEYLWGAGYIDQGHFNFKDWWAHDREGEKGALQGFISWAYSRWKANPRMHIYHYAPYEITAIRRLMSLHDTCQDEINELLRNQVFVDLYQIVKKGLRMGEENYSIKTVEKLYRAGRGRDTEVVTSIGSVVQYARWLDSGEPRDWDSSPILKGIRDYNEDDCKSTQELAEWLRGLASDNGIDLTPSMVAKELEESDEPDFLIEQRRIIQGLRNKSGDVVASVLADLMGFHRREDLPVWWRLFDRSGMELEDLRDDPGCIAGVIADGSPRTEKRSLVQRYRFDPTQECKLPKGSVMFPWELNVKFTVHTIDLKKGSIELKVGIEKLNKNFDGKFPQTGSLLPYEIVPAKTIREALQSIAENYLDRGLLPYCLHSLILRDSPCQLMSQPGETPFNASLRIANTMQGKCLVIQGPPGTGKTYTASQMIYDLLAQGKKIGIASNSHKAIVNLLQTLIAQSGGPVRGVRGGGDPDEVPSIPSLDNSKVFASYKGGVVAGTAWLFTRPEWEDQLDYLFIDEAGQVSLANAVAMSRCATNLVLMGDQMQLEQPIQGTHPGDAGLSVLQYALKDMVRSLPEAPLFHQVVPHELGIFLGETHRMHPSVCSFISESIYQGRLASHTDCHRQRIEVPSGASIIIRENGIIPVLVEHEGNTQSSEEEAKVVVAIVNELLGRVYTDKQGTSRRLGLDDILFMAPYNAQVNVLKRLLQPEARVGSVDKFQGQEAAVCILSLCSSYGEYGSRGLAFILDKNRINVAVSRAMCMAIVVADPRIAQSPASSLNEMTLLSLFCKATRGSMQPIL